MQARFELGYGNAGQVLSAVVTKFILQRYSSVASTLIGQGLRPPALKLGCRQVTGGTSCSKAFVERVNKQGLKIALPAHARECAVGRESDGQVVKGGVDNNKDFYAILTAMTALSIIPKDYFKNHAKEIWTATKYAAGILGFAAAFGGYEQYGNPVALNEAYDNWKETK